MINYLLQLVAKVAGEDPPNLAKWHSTVFPLPVVIYSAWLFGHLCIQLLCRLRIKKLNCWFCLYLLSRRPTCKITKQIQFDKVPRILLIHNLSKLNAHKPTLPFPNQRLFTTDVANNHVYNTDIIYASYLLQMSRNVYLHCLQWKHQSRHHRW